jgi:hypothetical protein
MQPVVYLKRLLPVSLKRFAQVAIMRSANVVAPLSTVARRIDGMVAEAEAANAALAELAHRTNYLKLSVEHIEVKLRDLSDDVETLISLNSKISALEIELANCRNLAEVALQAVEALQSGRTRTGT